MPAFGRTMCEPVGSGGGTTVEACAMPKQAPMIEMRRVFFSTFSFMEFFISILSMTFNTLMLLLKKHLLRGRRR